MSAASRNKGARYETEILRFFRERGGYVGMRSRQFKIGGGEEPDVLICRIKGGKPLQIEAKNRKTMPAKSHVAALEQAEACGDGIAIAISKVARKPIEDAIVTMRFGVFLELYEAEPSIRELFHKLVPQKVPITDPDLSDG